MIFIEFQVILVLTPKVLAAQVFSFVAKMVLPFPPFLRLWPFSALSKLEEGFDTIFCAFCFFHLIPYTLGGILSNRYSSSYRALPKGKKASWRIHLVSMTFSSLVIPSCIPLFFIPELLDDKLFGSSFYSTQVFGFAVGYFLWDLFITIIWFSETGLPFLLHAFSCLLVFGFSLYPYAHAYGPVFLLFEVSTIFLNIHWFCDKTGRSGSVLQWINGMLLLASFLAFRLIYGIYGKYQFVSESFARRNEIPLLFLIYYTIAAGFLAVLNVYWYSVMIKSVMSRFSGPKQSANKKQA